MRYDFRNAYSLLQIYSLSTVEIDNLGNDGPVSHMPVDYKPVVYMEGVSILHFCQKSEIKTFGRKRKRKRNQSNI